MKSSIIIFFLSIGCYGQVAIDTGYYEYHYMYQGLNKLNSKDFKGALEDYNKALKFGCKPYDKMGLCKMGLKDYNGAIQDFTKAIELTPTDEFPYSYRGSIKYKTGDKKGACEDWQKAFELGLIDAKEKINKYCK